VTMQDLPSSRKVARESGGFMTMEVGLILPEGNLF
jgi:hypothetical protein